ncbi:MAG: radical SAM protein [Promethearchaeota archaeon]
MEEIYYCYPVFRPPSERNSLLIQLTEGCTFKCDFCISNLRKQFKVRNIEDVKRDLEIARIQYGPNVRKVFFLDGNAMVAPTETILEITKFSFSLFPNLIRCSVYANAMDILKKKEQQLKELSEEGLKLAYVGFESGYDDLLNKVNKHATKQNYIDASKKLMDANITLSATFINGLGGANNPEISEKHAFESADLVNKICPEDNRIFYIAFLTLMIPSGTEIFKRVANNEFSEMDLLEILQELKIFIKNIEFQNKEANCIFRSNHASNYLPIKGILDRDKQKIIDVLNYGIRHTNILRPESFRGL